MSDSESSAEKIIHKRRRVQGACDECKRRKSDSASRPGNICSSCLAFQTECTHLSTKKKRGPPKGTPRGQKTITSIIRAINSAGQIYEPPTDIAAVKQLIVGIAGYAQHLEEENARLRDHPSSSNLSVMASADGNSDELQAPPGSYLDIDAHAVDGLIEHMKELKVHSARDRFFGGSSSLMLLQTAISVKNEYTGENSEMNSFQLQPPQGDKGGSVSADSCKRPEFWVIHPWQVIPLDNPPPFHFPDADLIDSLVSLYFSNVNVYFPILHKPTFSRSVSENLHLNDRHFGALLLAVCALGARFSDDDRVYEDGVLGPNGENRGQARVEQSVGWKWIRQIQLVRKSFTEPPSIYEIQLYEVYVFFMQATSTPESCWILVSIGVRFIQDVGAHRMKQDHLNKPTVENEVWKRAFWMLYVMDICISAFLGRPRSITHEDFDVDLPINVDDEYWENPDDPENTFQQPEGKPTMRSYFVSLIKLLDILGYAMRTIYAVRRTDIWTVKGMSGVEWNEKIVAELDSSLNKWLEEIPAHLRWDPHKENSTFFNQSTMLYTTYYWIQILIHRPFIAHPGEGSGSLLRFPSLAICANAARSCCRVMDVQHKKNLHMLAMPNITMALFTSSMVLLVNVWRGRRVRGHVGAGDLERELADVYRCVNMLSLQEKRRVANIGKILASTDYAILIVRSFSISSDLLREIMVMSQSYHEKQSALVFNSRPDPGSSSAKRSHEIALERVDDSGEGEGEGTIPTIHEHRPMAGSHRVSLALPDNHFSYPQTHLVSQALGMQFSSSSAEETFTLNLPTYSRDLGNLPIYESFTNFDLSMFDETPYDSLESSPLQAAELSAQKLGGLGLITELGPQPFALTSDDNLFSQPNLNDVSLNQGDSLPGFYSDTSTPNTDSQIDDWTSYMATVDEILHNVNPYRL